MAVKRPTLSGEILEGLSKVLGDTSNGLSNNEITKYLKEVDLPNVFPEGKNGREFTMHLLLIRIIRISRIIY